jgi:hypothetical protein
MRVRIEYEIPPLRGISATPVDALDVEGAVRKFKKFKPNARIRKVNGQRVKDDGRTIRPVRVLK